MVRLVPVAASGGLKGFGSLKAAGRVRQIVDKAFTPAVERKAARLFRGRV